MQNVTIPKPLVTLRDRRYGKKSRQAINLASRARRIKITINFYLSILVEILRKPKLVVTRVEYNIRTNAAWLLKVKSFLSSPTRHDGSHPFNFTVSSPHSPLLILQGFLPLWRRGNRLSSLFGHLRLGLPLSFVPH